MRRLTTIGRLATLILSGTTLLAQGVQTSDLSGELRDGGGNAVAGARITLTSPALQGQRAYVSDAKGRFSARLLPPGLYTIVVAHPAYQTLKVSQAVALGQSYTPRFVLQAEGNMTVEVVATLPQLDRTNTETSTNFELEKMDNLPTGRTPEAMMALTPGVADLAGQSVNGYAQIRGAMSSGNKFLVDGQDVADSVYGNRGISVISDAVDEIQVITGAISAEYGDVDGGVVNTVTKSGGNTFTGTIRSDLSNDAWNAVRPLQVRSAIVSKLTHDETVSLGGYFVKDKLWFFVSGFNTSITQSGSIDPNSFYAGLPYTTATTDKRLQTKFTYLWSQDHTLSLSYLTHRELITNNNFISGELASLEPQLQQDGAWSFTWAANWSSHLSMELRFGEKKEALTGGGTLPGVVPVYDPFVGLIYRNGLFNYNDGGDHRDNRSADLKFNLAFDWHGAHQLAFGLNYLNGVNRAQNQQSPTNSYFVFLGYDPTAATADAYQYDSYQSTTLKAYDDSLGLYVNDKWSINNRLTFNLGLRWDRFRASSQDTPATAGASGFSPRLGVKWDPLGNAKWIASASYSRYNAKPLSLVVNAISNAGNPSEVDYNYTGPSLGTDPFGAPIATMANATNPALYTQQIDYISPASTRLASDLRAPHTNEMQVSLARAFRFRANEAYLQVTAVRRDYKDLFDYTIGDSGHFTPPDPYNPPGLGTIYVKQWENSDLAKRVYKDLELEGGLQTPKWSVRGNLTWGSLVGNYQGEASGVGPAGQGLKYYTVQDGVKMYDPTPYNPYGPLIGDVPLRIRGSADYHFEWSWGTTTLGLIYRFDSGSHNSITRVLPGSAINDAFSSAPLNNTFTQYKDDQRGQVIFPSQAYTDFSVNQDFRIVKAGDTPVRFFLKVILLNVFNHQQVIAFQNLWNITQTANDPTSAWVPEAGNGQTTGAGDYGGPRQVTLQAGFKF